MSGNGDSEDRPRRVPLPVTARDVIGKLATDIRMLGVRRQSEPVHAVGNAMHGLACDTDAQALIDLLDDWAGDY